jgi:hypothetical protein
MKNVHPNLMISFTVVSGILLSAPAWSINEMTDGQLAAVTGQDGVTVVVVPPLSSGVTTLPINNITYADTDGIPSAVLSGYSNAASLRSDLQSIQFYGASMAAGSYSMKGVLDVSGGGAAGATTGLNPVLSATFTLPDVRTVSTIFNRGPYGAGTLLGVAPLGANAAGALVTNNALILPLLSVGTYAPYAGGLFAPGPSGQQRININLNSDLVIDLKLGEPSFDSMITFTSLNIASIDFNGQALNLESGSLRGVCIASDCSSRLSITPSYTGINLSGSTIDVLSAANLNTALGLPSGTLASGGLLFQSSSASITGIALNNVTAGMLNTTSSNFAGMINAPIGSFGASNVSVSNLKIATSGF